MRHLLHFTCINSCLSNVTCIGLHFTPLQVRTSACPQSAFYPRCYVLSKVQKQLRVEFALEYVSWICSLLAASDNLRHRHAWAVCAATRRGRRPLPSPPVTDHIVTFQYIKGTDHTVTIPYWQVGLCQGSPLPGPCRPPLTASCIV